MSDESKADVLKAVLPPSHHRDAVIDHVTAGSPAEPPSGVSTGLLQKAVLAAKLADLTNNNAVAVKEISSHPSVQTLRDAAYHYDPESIQKLAEKTESTGSKPLDADAFQVGLFHAEPNAVINRMVDDQKINMSPEVLSGVSKFLTDNSSHNMRQTSVVTALNQPDALQGISPDVASDVVTSLKTIQRVQALAPHPDAVPILLNEGITSAHHAAQMPKSRFMNKFQDSLGPGLASQIHDHAVTTTFRNDQALLHLHQIIKGAGLAVIDGKESVDTRMATFLQLAAKNQVEINLESLFGGMDYCECDDCTTVISPANYYVELLQYLRNNDLDPEKDSSGNAIYPNTGSPGYAMTALDVLLKRRPDLQHLQLTCANANTLIPYIDLANEVMESFVVHLGTYPTTWTPAAQSVIDVFNVTVETSDELIAEAQHTNYKAYCILRQAVYPLGSLPFHQPITAIRIYLGFLKTSRYEVVNIFRKPYATPVASPPFSPADDAKLRHLHDVTRDRAAQAEYLNIIQEEYIILTKEAFWPIEYFDITSRKSTGLTEAEYQHLIGVRNTRDYWGYDTDALLRDRDSNTKAGLMFVKAQFLNRSGMQYTDLVDLIQTNYVNPFYPSGKALAILDSIHFSYRFLQTLVNKNASNKKDKFAQLIEFLEKAQPWAEHYIQTHSIDQPRMCPPDISRNDICDFIYRWFECLAKLVVLESGEGPSLPVYGRLALYNPTQDNPPTPPNPPAPEKFARSTLNTTKPVSNAVNPNSSSTDSLPEGYTIVGTLYSDGTITDNPTDDGSGEPQGNTIGTVAIDSIAYTPGGDLFIDQYNGMGKMYIISFNLVNNQSTLKQEAAIDSKSALDYLNSDHNPDKRVLWNAVVDSCNIDTVRILHLDGTRLKLEEWDRMQRFIRLWKRLGWTIDETDKALSGLAATSTQASVTSPTPDPTLPIPDPLVGSSDFSLESCKGDGEDSDDDGECDHKNPDCHCHDKPIPENICKGYVPIEITPDFLKEVVRVQELQALTGVELTRLLALWANISIAGGQSLYSQLFLTNNLIGIDPVFVANEDGNYLTTTTPISAHLPVIMASLRLTQDALNTILTYTNLGSADLTIGNISQIYRYALFAQTLVTNVTLFIEAIKIFGDPFTDAESSLRFVRRFNGMTNAGFTVQQLTYVIYGADDPTRPLGPQLPTVLKTTKNILDGLNTINTTYADITSDGTTPIPIDTVTQNTTTYFDSTLVSQINELLQGQTPYSTNAPIGLTINVPASLSAKITYFDPVTLTGTNRVATLSCIGILTNDEISLAKSLASASGWSDAIDRIGKQALTFYNNNLAAIFPNQAEAISILLSGDIITPPTVQPPPTPDPDTAPIKIAYFLKYFMPYLRDQLSNQLIITTMAGEAGISSIDITTALLENILTISQNGASQSAMDTLKGLISTISATQANPADWQGYLIPPTSDNYTFLGIGDTQPASLIIDGTPLPFKYQQPDPNNVWLTDPIALTGGRLYLLDAAGQSVPGLQWKTARSAVSAIPSSALLPNISTSTSMTVFVVLCKAAIVINGFNLSIDEINYLQAHGADFSNFDLNNINIEAWERILAYSKLKTSLPALPSTILDLFKWASTIPSTPTPTLAAIATQINAVTNWVTTDVQTIIGPNCLNLGDVSLYVNEIALIKLQKALSIVNNVKVDIPSLFKWADPMAKFWPSHEIAEEIHDAIRSRYSLSDWEQAVTPLHNTLRMAQRDALIAYLTVQPVLNQWGVVDADSLFEFFLIDVQMGACLQTSRLKQAISTVQTFVQRCILGLEEEKAMVGYPTISNDTLDQVRWQWMSKQTIWTANRKVFLTPENYIVGSLRDDKSPLYLALENEMLQKDVSVSTIQDSFKNYLYGLDQVANLLVEGIFQDDDPNQTIYIVAKTRSPPYLYFSRTYALSTWTPWQSIPIDIPTYHTDAWTANPGQTDSTTFPANNGSYVIPVVMNSRFLVFFAQMTLKTIPVVNSSTTLTSPGAISDVEPKQTWDIKVGWTELQNGKWSHKQLSSDSIVDPTSAAAPQRLDSYHFVPRILSETIAGTQVAASFIQIGVYDLSSFTLGGFEFHGSKITSVDKSQIPAYSWSTPTSFQFSTANGPLSMYSYQSTGDFSGPTSNLSVQFPPSTSSDTDPSPVFTDPGQQSQIFNHSFSGTLLSVINATPDLSKLFSVFTDQDVTAPEIFGYSKVGSTVNFSELSAPYALYNWEIGFHAPLELAGSLFQNQQFDDALNMCHNVFNPYANGSDMTRVWQWPPFKDVSTINVLEAFFNGLQPNTPDAVNGPINSWRNNPFEPHVVARQRPVAYMKWTVMTYLQILIGYGDWYFRQNTLETVPLAIQCYILASHIYGPRAQKIPKRGTVKPQTYFSLLDKWDAFSNAVVDLELAFPFSNQTPHPIEFSGSDIVLANIFGFATTHYFAIPSNPQLDALRSLIDDRLYKIRHCQDINGNAISLALWDPPIDPALLVAAVAQGLSLSNVLNDLDSPMPNYRFYYLLQKALELCAEIKTLGNSFLSIKEKRDTEALQLLKAQQDNAIQNLVMQVRTLQVDEANKTLTALQTSRRGPFYRYQYFTSLAGATAAALADTDTDYSEIALSLPAPQIESDLVLTPNEKNEIDEAQSAQDVNNVIGPMEVFSSIMLMFPPLDLNVQPWGCGVSTSIGTDLIAKSTTAMARSLRISSDGHSFGSTSAARKAAYVKQYQERIQQANTAGYELLSINTQMVTQQSRIAAANQEITNQQAQIDNAAETLEFLTDKYTNDQLYAYLESTVRTLFYQTYTLAYDLAKKAEAAYVFERGPQPAPFIQFGYWDATNDGLESGEKLYLALKQLEAAYQADRGYDFEVVKQISVRQLNPWALLSLREKATCQIAIPEVLFDMDFPGHYSRRIKSVSITIPCIVGPYTNVNATLRLLQHNYRFDPAATDLNSYLPQTDGGPDPRFQTTSVPLASIAVSNAQADSGVFELNFAGERYLPFEGAGAISTWQLDLPDGFRQFDYDSINDIIITMRYTSLDGGDKLKAPASASVAAYIKSVEDLSSTQGLFALFDLRSEFATGWAQFTNPLPTATQPTNPPAPQTLALTNIVDRLPLFTKGRDPSKIIATDIHLVTATALASSAFTLSVDPSGNTDPVTFTQDPNPIGGLNVMSSADEVDANFSKPWALLAQIPSGTTVAWEKIWLVVRYTLTS